MIINKHKKVNFERVVEWQGKDQYLAELKKKREEYEKIKIKE